MGNRLITKTLREIAGEKEAQVPDAHPEVVFAAPDVDADTFRDFARHFNQLTKKFKPHRAPRLTLYTCKVDWALGLSKRFYHRDLIRAGDAKYGVIVALPMDTVEVTKSVLDDTRDDWSGRRLLLHQHRRPHRHGSCIRERAPRFGTRLP